MKIYYIALLLASVILNSLPAMAADSAIDPSTNIGTKKTGVLMATQFPAPQAWINMMPGTIGDPKKVPTVDVVMKLTNNSTQALNYTFPSSQHFDIFLKDIYGNIVSRWSRNKFFIQILTRLTILPGESASFGGSVELTTDDGQFIIPGDYLLSIEINNISTSPLLASTSLVTGSNIIGTINRRPSSQMPLRIDWAF